VDNASLSGCGAAVAVTMGENKRIPPIKNSKTQYKDVRDFHIGD
jgi:hypothetical protein